MDSSAPETPKAPLAPTGIRIASTLCWLVGVVSILVSIAMLPRLVWLIANLIAGGLVCVAGFLTRRQRRTGAYLVAFAWALPALVSLAAGGPAKPGPPLLLIAGIALLFNWKHLR